MIVEAWERAPALRSPLRDAGVRQVARGYEAYDRVAALMHSRSDVAAPAGVSRDGAIRQLAPRSSTLYRRLRSRSDVSRWSDVTASR